MTTLENLEKYYYTEHKDKIFCTKLCVNEKCFNILYNYDKHNEVQKFVSNFSEYFPYYVSNGDRETKEEYSKLIDYGLPITTVDKISHSGISIEDLKAHKYDEKTFDNYERIIVGEVIDLL